MKHKDALEQFMDYDVFLPTRTLYVGSAGDQDGEETGTDYKMAEKAVKALHVLEHMSPLHDKPITVIMNNLGGFTEHGMAIFDAIKSCKDHVTIKVSGQAMSMGSIILQAADDRLMFENATLMIHRGDVAVSGALSDAKRWVKNWEKNDAKIHSIFLEKIQMVHPDFSLEKFKNKINSDWILSAQEALDMGLIDGIILDQSKIVRRAE